MGARRALYDSARSRRYREAAERLEPFEQLARVVIMSRAKLGLSQRNLAKRMGTTPSVISRIESGQHPTKAETVGRLAKALSGHASFGFDFGTPNKSEHELVAQEGDYPNASRRGQIARTAPER